jgi:hypothetical protein
MKYQVAGLTINFADAENFRDRRWKALIRGESIVESIKEARAQYGLGLKEAKDLVEAYRDWWKKLPEEAAKGAPNPANDRVVATQRRHFAGREGVVTSFNDGTFSVTFRFENLNQLIDFYTE